MSRRSSGRLVAITATLRPPTPRRRARRIPLPALAVVAGTGTALLLGGPVGVLAGAVLAAAVLRLVPRLEPRATRRRRLRLQAQAPDVLDLLAACLASGATVPSALAATADGVDEPAAGVLGRAAAAQRLGAPPEVVWAVVAQEPALAGLAAAVRRSADTGAPLAEALPLLADDLRQQRRADLEASARTVGVRLTAPLALAFLPAFVLLGVVPVVASLLESVLVVGLP